MATAISVENLSKTYTEGLLFRRNHKALQNVSLDVRHGEVFGLLGPNGAGKTTLIKILLGILHPNEGKAKVLEMEAGSKAARRKIGYLPENLIFPRHHTGRSALYFYGRLSELSDSDIAAKEDELFAMVDLKGRQDEAVRRYSKGMRQRLGLAQAMLHDPDLLIFDEPTDGLDPMGRSQIRDLLTRLKERGKTVFLNSHILQEVELVCDRVAIMALGQLRGVGTIEELIQQNPMAQRGTVHLDIPISQGNIRETLNGFKIGSMQVISGNESLQRIEIEAPEQADVDRIVDTLRHHGISIVRVERYRPSLEQVFMSIVGSVPPHIQS
ncbi:MAG: ABC transporter ATP-binding protein [Planctomycetes bacterium]|nr:ABC transporter ATP-binding protein [Planctomycetota bacterium]